MSIKFYILLIGILVAVTKVIFGRYGLFFFDCVKCIEEKRIRNVLLMSRRVFDQVNRLKCNEASRAIFKTIAAFKMQVILTGGNHDSPMLLMLELLESPEH
jgi:hypothetical protein